MLERVGAEGAVFPEVYLTREIYWKVLGPRE